MNEHWVDLPALMQPGGQLESARRDSEARRRHVGHGCCARVKLGSSWMECGSTPNSTSSWSMVSCVRVNSDASRKQRASVPTVTFLPLPTAPTPRHAPQTSRTGCAGRHTRLAFPLTRLAPAARLPVLAHRCTMQPQAASHKPTTSALFIRAQNYSLMSTGARRSNVSGVCNLEGYAEREPARSAGTSQTDAPMSVLCHSVRALCSSSVLWTRMKGTPSVAPVSINSSLPILPADNTHRPAWLSSN